MNEKIAKYTGQAEICREIMESINKGKTFIIEADSGRGKTELCKYIKNKIEANEEWIVLVLSAAENIDHEPLIPFFDALSNCDNFPENIIKNILTTGSTDIPFVGNTISSILDVAFDSINISLKNHKTLEYFNEQEQYILKIIKTLIKNCNTVFICEDIDKWDDSSVRLLNLLVNQKLDNTSFERINYILTASILPKAINLSSRKIYHLTDIKKCDLEIILNELNPYMVYDNQTLALIYTITGGNLQLIIDCCDIANCIATCQPHSSFYDIIKRRIENSSLSHEQVIKLLQLASVIGIKFKKTLLKRFSETEIFDFDNTLSESTQLEILNDDTKNIFFSHKLLRDCFYKSLGENKYKYHLQLEKSLNDIIPSLYKVRAYNLFYGLDYNNAAKLYVIYLIEYLRKHGSAILLQGQLYEELKNHKYFDFYKEMNSAYISYFNGEFAEAYSKVEMLENDEIEFSFEIDYLYALICTNKHYSISEFKYGVERLKKWDYEKFKVSFPEMWLRASMLLLDFEFEMNIQPEGENRLQEMRRMLDQKSSTDSVMRNRKYDLFLKSNIYSKIEIAFYQTKKALDYYDLRKNTDLYKYYIALLNHSGNELVLGEHKMAYEHTITAINMIKTFPNIAFLKQEVLINNHILSGYLFGIYSTTQCIDLLNRYKNKFDNFADELLINNNLVAFFILNKDFENALEISEELYNQVTLMDDTDSYYAYFIINNYMILQHLLGNSEQVSQLLNKLIVTIPLDKNKYYFQSRNNYIQRLIQNNPIIDINDANWNDSLVIKYPKTIGKAWSFWGKLLLFSDLQIWSDC